MVRAARLLCLVAIAVSCSDGVLAPAKRNLSARASFALGDAGLPPIVITEVMADPSKVADASGEWFELYNGGATDVNLRGFVLGSNNANETQAINADLIVPAQGYVVLGINDNSATNGGLTVNYKYTSTFSLNNSQSDWITLKTSGGALVDSVAWAPRDPATGATSGSNPPSGRSRQLIDVNSDNTILNGANWQNATTTFGAGDFGTPGTGPGGVVTPPEPAGPVASVTVTPSPATSTVGGTVQLSATGKDAAGKTSATTFTWTIDRPEIATISASGLVTGVAEGSAVAKATSANGIDGTTTVTVSLPAPSRVSISPNGEFHMPAGFQMSTFATVFDASNRAISPTPALTWASDNSDVATVDALGYITAIAPGTVHISATTANGTRGQITFTVNPATASTSAVYRNHLEFGMPADANTADDIILTKPQFVVSYNANRGGANWVAWDLNESQFGSAARCDCFSPDPQLPSNVYHVVDLDYRNGGYDRGHMAMSEERTTTEQENAATFYLTNVLPQSANVNQGPWLNLETYLNDLARTQHKEVYVIAGGIYAAAPPTLKNEGKVAVPDYTWKIALVLPSGAGLSSIHALSDVQTIAVKMPNLVNATGPASADNVPRNSSTPWQNYQTTVDAIEQATGYDFLAALPDDIEIPLEANDKPPVARIAEVAAAVEGSPVAFDGSASSDPDGDALTYRWEFGDGIVSADVSPSHTYADNGTFTATLTVKDPAGAFHVATTTVVVQNAAPRAQIEPLGATTIVSGETFTVRGSYADAGLLDAPWNWWINWGEGSQTAGSGSQSGTSFFASRSFLAAGSYTVRMWVTDKDGATGTANLTLQVVRKAISISVNPNAIKLNDDGNGNIKVTVRATSDFDPATLDLSTARIGNVFALQKTAADEAEDAADGSQDVKLRFRRDALIQSGALGANTLTLTLLADLLDGRQVAGTTRVNVH